MTRHEEYIHPLQGTRQATVASLRRARRFDVLVIGGGIHGATCARLAAFNNLRTVLLERDDYGARASGSAPFLLPSRPLRSDVLHLAALDRQLRTIADLAAAAPHLVERTPLQDRSESQPGGQWLVRLLGARFPHWGALRAEGSSNGRMFGGYRVHPLALVQETVLSARQEGATCLNHAEVLTCAETRRGSVEVSWRDCLTGERYQLEAGVVLNCAGIDALSAGRITRQPLASGTTVVQRGYLVLEGEWHEPSALVSLRGQQALVGIIPSSQGVLVGPIEVATRNEATVPTGRLWERVRGVLPPSLQAAERIRTSYSYPALRSQASARARWVLHHGVFTLMGGEFEYAARTAHAALSKVASLAGLRQRIVSLAARPLPGAFDAHEERMQFVQGCRDHNVPPAVRDRIVGLLGGRVRWMSLKADAFQMVDGVLLRGEVQRARCLEQAETPADVLRRTLLLDAASLLPTPAMPELEVEFSTAQRLRESF